MDIQNVAYYQDPQFNNSNFLVSLLISTIVNPLIPQNAFGVIRYYCFLVEICPLCVQNVPI